MYGFGLDDHIADYAAIELVNSYAGTVSFASEAVPGLEGGGGSPTNQGIAVTMFTMESGAINQEVAASELFVLGSFTGTGGTINSSTFTSKLTVGGGGTIDPNGATIATGSNIPFFGPPTGPAVTTTVKPGTIQFNNAAGAAIRPGTAEQSLLSRQRRTDHRTHSLAPPRLAVRVHRGPDHPECHRVADQTHLVMVSGADQRTPIVR